MSNTNIDWSDAIKKEARGVNGEDLGEVQEVNNGYVTLKRGIINKEQFYIPQNKAVDYDGSVVTFSISEDEMKSNYTEMRSSFDSIDTTATSSYRSEGQTTQQQTTDETTIPLTEEKLDVSKNSQEEQMTISKEPVTRTETVDVPITHEEISIERRPASGQTQAQSPVTSREVITIPVRREEVEVTKTPYIIEEVVVKKKPITENRQVTEEATSEEVKTTDEIS